VTFVILILAGAGCFAIALFTIPMIVLRPAKFALSYTVGSLLILTRSVGLLSRATDTDGTVGLSLMSNVRLALPVSRTVSPS